MDSKGVADRHGAFTRFRKNPLALVSSLFIILSVLLAVLGYLITPDKTPQANKQFLEIAREKPGFSVGFLLSTKNHKPETHSFIHRMLFGEEGKFVETPIDSFALRESRVLVYPYTNALTPLQLDMDLADVLFSVNPDSASWIAGERLLYYSPEGEMKQINLQQAQALLPEKHVKVKHFRLGTDRYGRDMISQLVIGMRVSLSVGFMAVLISLLIGVLLGALAGFFGSWIDHAIMWLINVVWSMPSLLLVIAITFALGKGFWQVFLAIGFTMWVEVARVVRGQIMSIREKEFVEAAKALGYSDHRIIFRHILPNVISPVIVVSAANFATAILIEAGLSFLGIGVQPPMPSWGTMIRDHAGYIILDSAFLAFLPGVAIMLMVLAFMVAGNGLRDALDVKT